MRSAEGLLLAFPKYAITGLTVPSPVHEPPLVKVMFPVLCVQQKILLGQLVKEVSLVLCLQRKLHLGI